MPNILQLCARPRGCGAGGACRTLRYDARENARAQLAAGRVAGITHGYYFATLPIFGASAGPYDKERFEAFRIVYVDGFAALCEALAADGGEIGLYYPSSVAVTERPARMGEYAMVKAAGEILCEEIARRHCRLHILTTRLPRMATDQTAALISAGEEASTADILLPILHRVQARQAL